MGKMLDFLKYAAAARRLALFGLFLGFEVWMVLVGSMRPEARLTPFEFGLLVLAGCLGGPAVAYFPIGEWLRHPLVQVTRHPSGVGECTEARYHGALEAIGNLLSCPICAGTWVCGFLYTLHAFYPAQSLPMWYVMAAGGALSLLVRHREKDERINDAAWEVAGYLRKQNIAQEDACPTDINLDAWKVLVDKK